MALPFQGNPFLFWTLSAHWLGSSWTGQCKCLAFVFEAFSFSLSSLTCRKLLEKSKFIEKKNLQAWISAHFYLKSMIQTKFTFSTKIKRIHFALCPVGSWISYTKSKWYLPSLLILSFKKATHLINNVPWWGEEKKDHSEWWLFSSQTWASGPEKN